MRITTLISLASFCVLLGTATTASAQCTNPTPVGDANPSFCAADEKQLSDLAVSTNPPGGTIEWYTEATNGLLIDENQLLANNTTYYASDASGGGCSTTRLAVSVTVDAYPPNLNSVVGECQYDQPTLANLTAVGENIEWFLSEVGGTALAESTLLQDSTVYWAQQTVNGCVSKRNNVFLYFITVPEPIFSVDYLTQEFCETDAPTIANLDIESNANINWYADSNSTIPLSSNVALVSGTDYWAAGVSITNCESGSRVRINAVIDETPSAGSNSTFDICALTLANNPINMFDYISGTPDTGGYWTSPTNEALQNGYLGTYTKALNTPGTYTYTVGSLLGICDSSSVTVQINELNSPAPSTDDTLQSFCTTDTATLANLQITGTSITWYASPSSTTELPLQTLLVDGEDYFATQTSSTSSCESTDRQKIKVKIDNSSAPTTTEPTQTFCKIDSATLANIDLEGTAIKWYDSELATTPLVATTLLSNGTTYFASQTTTSGCESSERLEITIVITDTLAPTTALSTRTFCLLDSATLSQVTVDGSNIKWYASSGSSTPLVASATRLEDGKSYYASQATASGCESTERLEISIELNSTDQPELKDEGNLFCANLNVPTLGDLDMNLIKQQGVFVQWYNSYPNGQLLSDTITLSDTETYYAVATDSLSQCSSTPLEVNVELDNCIKNIEVFDGFSPNGDGVNDEFYIDNIEELFPNYTIDFFNRWGNKMYEAKAGKANWNGQLNGDGEAVPVGVYYYVIHFNDDKNTEQQGHFYLSR